MSEHTFTLVFTMGATSLEPHLDGLVDAGCDDGTFAGPASDGTFVADFDREAPAFGAAVVSAVRALRATLPGFRLLRVEPDDLVSQSAIAERVGRTTESVRLLIMGQRGPGGFPPAVAAINHKTQVWSWAEVSRWWTHAIGEQIEGADRDLFIAALNASLRSAGVTRELRERESDLIAELAAEELAAH